MNILIIYIYILINEFLYYFLATEIKCCCFLSRRTVFGLRVQYEQSHTLLDQSNCRYLEC